MHLVQLCSRNVKNENNLGHVVTRKIICVENDHFKRNFVEKRRSCTEAYSRQVVEIICEKICVIIDWRKIYKVEGSAVEKAILAYFIDLAR